MERYKAMNDELISFETAKLAKEKGFDVYQNSQYSKGVNPTTLYNYSLEQCNLFKDIYYAATQSLLRKWIRDVHGWHIIIIPVVTMAYTYKIMKVWTKDSNPEEDLKIETPPYKEVNAFDYSTFEESLENGLQEMLNLI